MSRPKDPHYNLRPNSQSPISVQSTPASTRTAIMIFLPLSQHRRAAAGLTPAGPTFVDPSAHLPSLPLRTVIVSTPAVSSSASFSVILLARNPSVVRRDPGPFRSDRPRTSGRCPSTSLQEVEWHVSVTARSSETRQGRTFPSRFPCLAGPHQGSAWPRTSRTSARRCPRSSASGASCRHPDPATAWPTMRPEGGCVPVPVPARPLGVGGNGNRNAGHRRPVRISPPARAVPRTCRRPTADRPDVLPCRQATGSPKPVSAASSSRRDSSGGAIPRAATLGTGSADGERSAPCRRTRPPIPGPAPHAATAGP